MTSCVLFLNSKFNLTLLTNCVAFTTTPTFWALAPDMEAWDIIVDNDLIAS